MKYTYMLFNQIDCLKANTIKETKKSVFQTKQNENEYKEKITSSDALKSPSKIINKSSRGDTKKDTYKQTKHVRQRSCDLIENNNNVLNDTKSKKFNESKHEIKQLTKDVSKNIDQIYNTYNSDMNKGNNYGYNMNEIRSNNDNKGMTFLILVEINENSEYTPQFINLEDKQRITATALYDFIPQRVMKIIIQKAELGFNKGDIIEIEIIKDNGWWEGCLNGERGLIPYNYIRINE